MSVELITSGTIQNPPYDELITIKAFEVKDVFYDFNYFRVTEGIYSRGDIEYRFSETGQPAKFVAGQAIKLNQVVQRVSIRNTTDEDITITIALGIGDIYDDRLSVSGQLQVVNGDTVLGVEDEVVGNLLSGQTLGLKQGLTDLTGASYAQIVNSAGTFTVVGSGGNTNGIILKLGTISAFGGGVHEIRVDGNPILSVYRGSGSGASNSETIRDVFIPSGVSFQLYVQTNVLNTLVGVWYVVL